MKTPDLTSPNQSFSAEETIRCIACAALNFIEQLSETLNAERLRDEQLQLGLTNLTQQVRGAEEQLAGLREETQLLRTEQFKAIARLLQHQETHTHNLEQVRLKTESLDRKMEVLSSDFIDREVTEPLFKEMASIYEALLYRTNTPETQAVAQSISRFLEDHGLRLIHPAQGEPFNPREHQCLSQQASEDHALHGRIASVYRLGLSSQLRVLQAARVEVFTCKPSVQT